MSDNEKINYHKQQLNVEVPQLKEYLKKVVGDLEILKAQIVPHGSRERWQHDANIEGKEKELNKAIRELETIETEATTFFKQYGQSKTVREWQTSMRDHEEREYQEQLQRAENNRAWLHLFTTGKVTLSEVENFWVNKKV